MSDTSTHEPSEIAALLELAGEEQGRQILRALGTAGALGAFDRHCATSYAQKLLRERLARRSVAYRVSAKYGISLKSAYRRIEDALGCGPILGQNPP